MKLKFTLILWILSICFGFSQTKTMKIVGKITDDKGEPIPFASVLIENTTEGISANAQGNYVISLLPNQNLKFSAIGYETQIKKNISFNNSKILTLNVTLQPQSYILDEVHVGKYEDPAYPIIRKAIQLRKIHLDEIKAFSCEIYTKSVQKLLKSPKKFLGFDIKEQFDLDSNNSGILYQSEALAQFHFKAPNLKKEIVISSKVAGNNQALTFNSASDVRINFYENRVLKEIPGVPSGFVSPVAAQALSFYKYKLLGNAKENGHTIYKIQFEPKNTKSPTFSGVIYIADESFYITNISLNISKDSGVQIFDAFEIQQQYTFFDTYYLPVITQYNYLGSFLSFKFGATNLGAYRNYNLKPNFSPKFFNGEVLRIDSSAIKLDSTYWNTVRPVPLSTEEIYTYHKKDSVYQVKNSPKYLDSMDKKRNQFKLLNVLGGYSYYHRKSNTTFGLNNILSTAKYNTVQGFVLDMNLFLSKRNKNQTSWGIYPQLSYGFGNRQWNSKLSFSYLFDPLLKSRFEIGVGSEVKDLNSKEPFTSIYNTTNILFFGQNLSKYYRSKHVFANYNSYLLPGLYGSFSASYLENSAMQNTSFYNFRKHPASHFSSNHPFQPQNNTLQFETYRNVKISAKLSYRFESKYITRSNQRYYQSSKYPTVTLFYEKSIPGIAKSNSSYDYLQLGIEKQNMDEGLWGNGSFQVKMGKFLTRKNLVYPDFIHFSGTQTLISPRRSFSFNFLDMYTYSAGDSFLEAHYQHNFGGRWTNKIPLLRKLHLEEVIDFNTLFQKNLSYQEINFGFSHFSGFKLSYGFAFQQNQKVMQGFRLNLIF